MNQMVKNEIAAHYNPDWVAVNKPGGSIQGRVLL